MGPQGVKRAVLRDLKRAGIIHPEMSVRRFTWAWHMTKKHLYRGKLSLRDYARTLLLADYISDDSHTTDEGVVLPTLGIRYGGTVTYELVAVPAGETLKREHADGGAI